MAVKPLFWAECFSLSCCYCVKKPVFNMLQPRQLCFSMLIKQGCVLGVLKLSYTHTQGIGVQISRFAEPVYSLITCLVL